MGFTEQPNIKLGDTVKDRITGFSGVVVAITHWLNGCKRVSVQPRTLHEGKPIESQVFDIEQLLPVENADNFSAPKPTGGGRPNTGAREKDPR